ncbi:MAG: histidinol-phosphate transaminase [Anaerolineae bacterium]|nr:histidinol-phosphate transaminase [Anaerolineae bacterium]
MNVEDLFCSHVHSLQPYEPPDWEGLAARAGIAPGDLVRLNANENHFGPSPRAVQALAEYRGYGLYPEYGVLKRAVARYAGVAAENVVVGNGSDELIDLVVRLFVEPGEGGIVCPPAFGSYSISTLAHRGQVLNVPLQRDFTVDVDGIEALVSSGEASARPKLLFVTSPGNPDGQSVPLDTIRRLLALPIAVVVDQAYVEFGGESAAPLIAEHPKLVVLRSVSKWAGLAGLRFGYALAARPVAAALDRIRPVYNVNAAAITAVLATLEDEAYVRNMPVRVAAERARLQSALAALPGVRVVPSEANFLLCRFDDRTGADVAGALAKQGILVRAFSDPSLSDAVRITVGRPEQNERVVEAMGKVLGSGYRIVGSGDWGLDGVGTGPPVLSVPCSTRKAEVERRTGETDAWVNLDLDGTGRYDVNTGLGFLDHMLAQVAAHGVFDLAVEARGDLEVDAHHTVEDVAIALGQALDRALGERRGVVRMGHAYAPLDEALARVVIDLSGRPYSVVEVAFDAPRLGAMDADLVIHFLETLAVHGRLSLHAAVLYGRNDHHRAEALFKALGRALAAATRFDPRRGGVPSTKGVL